VIESFTVTQFDPKDIDQLSTSEKIARSSFGRGLAVWPAEGRQYFCAGSSPATVALYKSGSPTPLKTVQISKDVRHAVHGLEFMELSESN
jgi:hypothetical protein